METLLLYAEFNTHSRAIENVEAIQLLDNMAIVRRLQRKKPFELV